MDWATRKRTVRKLCLMMNRINKQVEDAATLARTLSAETASHLAEPAAQLIEFERQINMVRSVMNDYTPAQIDAWIKQNTRV